VKIFDQARSLQAASEGDLRFEQVLKRADATMQAAAESRGQVPALSGSNLPVSFNAAGPLPVIATAHEMAVLIADACSATLTRENSAPASATVPVTAECSEVWAFHMDTMAARCVRATREGEGWTAAQRGKDQSCNKLLTHLN
jgi:hypothetical protein